MNHKNDLFQKPSSHTRTQCMPANSLLNGFLKMDRVRYGIRDIVLRTIFKKNLLCPLSIPHRQTCRNHEFPLANFPFDFSQYVKNSKGEREQARKKEIRGIAEEREGRRGVRGASKLWQFVVGCVDAASARRRRERGLRLRRPPSAE